MLKLKSCLSFKNCQAKIVEAGMISLGNPPWASPG